VVRNYPTVVHFDGLTETVTAAGSGLATRRFRASVTNMCLRTSLDGQTLKIDVFPQATSADAFAEIRIITSNRPARGGRSSGQYVVTYRFGGGGAVGPRVKKTSTSGVVTRSAPNGRWTTLTLDPVRDMGQLWPGVDFRDAALCDLELGVGARQLQRAAVVFDYLRFDRQRKTASDVMTVQRSLMSRYDAQFPTVKQYRGWKCRR